ncbi:MAG TPA: F-box-like domain-containing protein [Trinickia sp.]|uniref:F-box-like domain-containing protein n=1 Tax=Trinickia sp. TaxID=2571163 RepID=UPI002C76A1AF|nr:F-box-like domain-containing protein [Trinickia sp.]HVW51826.1 F-box-like domain-containing protein [Trinickia sp.]
MLPQELVNYIFSFLTVREATQIMRVCTQFHYAGRDQLQRRLAPYVTNSGQIQSLSQARQVLARPLAMRLNDLYAILSDLENYLRGEEWNMSPQGLAAIREHYGEGPTYTTGYLPSTLPNASNWPGTHFTTVQRALIHNIQGESFDLGYNLQYTESTPYRRLQKYTVDVDVLEFLRAIRHLIQWLRAQRHRFHALLDEI